MTETSGYRSARRRRSPAAGRWAYLVRRDHADHGRGVPGVAGAGGHLENEFYVTTRNYTFQFDATTWGWIHLIGGIIVAFAGWGLLSGRTWARTVAIIRGRAQRHRQLLVHSLLPVLVVAHHRPGHRRHLGGGRPRRRHARPGLTGERSTARRHRRPGGRSVGPASGTDSGDRWYERKLEGVSTPLRSSLVAGRATELAPADPGPGGHWRLRVEERTRHGRRRRPSRSCRPAWREGAGAASSPGW